MNTSIIKFLTERKVMSLATSINDQPYCAHCFFAFDSENNCLLFLSDENTRHISEAVQNQKVGGTINAENVSVAKLQGIQFTGHFIQPDSEVQKQMYEVYYSKHPFARAKPAPIWAIELHTMKMTDNTLGFGTKHHWSKEGY
ncbi:MAG: hypothetical protein ACI9FU_000502 [Granulosicoccus sp.]|jgi:uncharacterized protein YhbP (UPF0306 family)